MLIADLFSQLASVILKQYVETHWCSQSEKFRPPETTERVRFGFMLSPLRDFNPQEYSFPKQFKKWLCPCGLGSVASVKVCCWFFTSKSISSCLKQARLEMLGLTSVGMAQPYWFCCSKSEPGRQLCKPCKWWFWQPFFRGLLNPAFCSLRPKGCFPITEFAVERSVEFH